VTADQPTSPTGTPAALRHLTYQARPEVAAIQEAYQWACGTVINPLDADDLTFRGWTAPRLLEMRRLAQYAMDNDTGLMAHFASPTAASSLPTDRVQKIGRDLYDFTTKTARAYARYGPRREHLTQVTALPYALAWATVLVSEPVVGAVTRLAYSPTDTGMPDGWLTPRPETAPWAWSAGFTADEAAVLPVTFTAANLQAMAVLRGCRFPAPNAVITLQ
jgi:hypothetical protein